MAHSEKQPLCWAQRITKDGTEFGHIGNCPFRKKEAGDSRKMNELTGILRILSQALRGKKVICTLPEGATPPKRCTQGKDYFSFSHHK